MTQPNTKPHTKVHVSVAHHPKTSEVWADLRERGMLVEVWRLAVERYAAKRDDTLALRPLDRLAIVPDKDQDGADADLKSLFKRLKYPLRRYSNRWEVKIRNLSKKHGFRESTREPESSPLGSPKKEERREKRKERRSAATPEAETLGQDVADTAVPPGYESGDWFADMLAKNLQSKATEAEMRLWVEAKWIEIVSSAEIEAKGENLSPHVKRIGSARWNTYLKTRDPTQRQFYREVATRQKSAALQALDAQLESQARASPPDANADEIDDDDPLRFMKLGANPHAH